MTDAASWPGETLWLGGLGNVRNLVRQALVTRQLASHLPEPDDALEVLDVGCGQGTQLRALARAGYRSTGIDVSIELLDRARADLAQEPATVGARVTLRQGDIDALGEVVDRDFDLVLCHGLLMYLPSLEAAVEKLAAVVKPGGLISLLTRNRASLAMRAGMAGNWRTALDNFDARHYDNRLGLGGLRADEPEEVIGVLAHRGVHVVAWYGVRLFTDHWGDVTPGEDFDELVRAEEEAGRRDPYRRLASLTHVIGRTE